MDRPNILALDMSSKTGYAYRDQSGKIMSGSVPFSLKRGESPGMVFVKFRHWLQSLITSTHPTVVVYEQSFFRGAGSQTLYGFPTTLMAVCAEQNIEHTPVPVATLKKWFAHNGRAGKEAMMETVTSRTGIIPVDDNEADAIALLLYGEWKYA